ncbi:MAG: CHAD domain-containing protein [Bryobacteraceae bacterium]
MREYVRAETARLLERFGEELGRAARDVDADGIHDLRVSIRRLSQCLRVFASFYPGRSWKKIRAELRGLLQSAGAVRDRDIALELIEEAGVSARAGIHRQLRAQRKAAEREMVEEIGRWNRRDPAAKWRRKLEIE